MIGTIGPVMIDVAGCSLREDEVAHLRDPRVGGVILFTRNYQDRAQLARLVAALRAVRHAPLLIAVDHEGGRVQRFRSGFSLLPAMATLGRLHLADPQAALQAAEDIGFVLAHELRQCDLDFSFTPVLDLDFGRSAVIGQRAFARDPARAGALATALVTGLEAAGSGGIGKHFPGHGHVEADSHLDLPVDTRSLAELQREDIQPFRALAGRLRGIMPAHVVYPQCDRSPAGFSAFWLQQVLRAELQFEGAIFSDDLAMAGALGAGTPVERARAAFAAGCDMVLLCNDPSATAELLEGLDSQPLEPARSAERLGRLRGRASAADAQQRYLIACRRLDALALDGWQAA